MNTPSSVTHPSLLLIRITEEGSFKSSKDSYLNSGKLLRICCLVRGLPRSPMGGHRCSQQRSGSLEIGFGCCLRHLEGSTNFRKAQLSCIAQKYYRAEFGGKGVDGLAQFLPQIVPFGHFVRLRVRIGQDGQWREFVVVTVGFQLGEMNGAFAPQLVQTAVARDLE